MLSRLLPFPKVTVSSPVQPMKAASPMLVTPAGMVMAERLLQL